MTRARVLVSVLGGLAGLAVWGYLGRLPRGAPIDLRPGVELCAEPGVSIRRAARAFGRRMGKGGQAGPEIYASSATLRELIPWVFELPTGGLIVETELPAGRFDVVVERLEGAPAPPEERLASALEATFGLRLSFGATRKLDVLLLEPMEGSSPEPLPPGTQRSQSSRGGRDLHTEELVLTWAELAEHLAHAMEVPIVTDESSSERFEFRFEWRRDDPADSFDRDLAANGIALRPVARELPVLVVEAR